MRIVGEWLLCDDAVIRPVVQAQVIGASGKHLDHFLLDTGADRTVFSAGLLGWLGLPPAAPPQGLTLIGISGASPFVVVETTLELPRDDGRVARVGGEFTAFTEPSASDLSVLGRDVLANFDLIIGRHRGGILLLAPNHRYQVIGA